MADFTLTGDNGSILTLTPADVPVIQLAGALAGPQGTAGAAGAAGNTGPQGVPGPSNNLSIGTVTAGGPSASITGVSPSQTLNLALPTGVQATPTVSGIVKQTVYNVRDYGAKGDTKQVLDGAMTNASATLTSATASFSINDVGKPIVVAGAAASGNSLNTTISAYISVTQVTLAASAGTTVSSAMTTYGTDDSAAVIAAENAAIASGNGGIIHYPPGGYATKNTTPGGVMNNIWHRGSGRGATTLYTLGTGYALSLGQNSIAGAISKNLRVSDMTIDMANNNNGNVYGITALMCQDMTIDNVHFKNQKNGAKSMFFFGVSSGSSDNFPRNLLVSNSIFSDSDAAWESITLGQCFNAKFVNCIFRDKTSQGLILVYDCYEFSMVNCETINANHFIDGNGTATITGCQHFASGWLVNGATAGDVSFIGGSFRDYDGVTAGQISIVGTQAGDTENAWDGVAGSMSVRPNITIIGTEFEGCNESAVVSGLFTDRNGIYRSPIKNFTMIGCTVHNSSWQGVQVAADFINISDSTFKNNRQGAGVGSSAAQNLALSGGVIKLRNVTSLDDQSSPTINTDIYVDQQTSTLQAYPQTLLYIEDCQLTRGSGITFYNGSFTSTPPANVFVFPRGNTGLAQTITSFSVDEKGGGINAVQVPNPSAPTVAPVCLVTDGVTTLNSTVVTSATANFVSGDVGLSITGVGIPNGTTISSVTNSTTAVLSANATATNTLIYFTIGRTGATTANYYIVAKDRAGNKTLASSVGTTTTGFASLSAVNFNQITWSPVRGAVQYDVLKGDTAHLLATVTNALTYNDIGGSTSAYTNPSRNATGDALIAGRLTLPTGAATNALLSSDSSGNASWQSPPLTIAQGGTGSTTQNFVDITTTQTVSGLKTFTKAQTITSGAAANFVPLTINQNDTTNNPIALGITNAGAGNAVTLTNSGNGRAIQIISSATTAGSSNVAGIDFDSTTLTTALPINVTVNSASFAPVSSLGAVSVRQQNASSGARALYASSAGSGDAIFATNSGSGLSLNLSAGNANLGEAVNIAVGTTTGTKIGTGTTQKLGFYNATPVVQPTGDVITALTNLGLVSSPTITSTDVTGLSIASGKTLTVSNTITLAGTDSTTMTFPSTSATIARTDAANTFTGHQTIEGVTSTGATGTGNLVFSTSPTLVTPALGTPASGVATNLTGTASSLTAGAVTNATLTTALTVNTGTLTLTANSANTSVLTVGAGAVSVSGSNTGDQTITLTGNVTGSGTGSFATTIAAGVVTNAMLAGSIAASKLVGTDIATVGTITAGTWTGTTIAVANGGTGAAAFTQGSVVFAGASGVYTQQNGGIFFDASNTRLGLNTATPKYLLDAAGTIRATNTSSNPNSGSGLEMAFNTGTSTGNFYSFNRATSAYLPLNFNDKIMLLANGNFGIGTTTPTNILSLGGQSSQIVWMERQTTANTAGNSLTIYSGGATSASTNKSAGNLNLSTGLSTGSGTGSILLQVTNNVAASTTDNALVTIETISLTGTSIAGNLTLATAGNKLNITTGSNASAGTGTLSGGTVTISTTAVTANSLIFLQDTNTSIVNVGTLTVSAKTAGTSFVVTSTNVADTSTFSWFLIN